MSLLLFLLIPFLGVLVAGTFPLYARNLASWFAAAVALAGVVLTLLHYPAVVDAGVERYQLDWMPAYGINFVLRMDGLVWLFTLLIQGMCLLVVLYARYYMSSQDPVPRFYTFLLAFMAAMQGVVLSGNLIQLVVFWELTSIASFLLIGYWHHRTDARRGARMSLTVTAAGGLCLLLGMLLLGYVTGTWDVDQVLKSGDTVRNHPWYLLILVLVALGAFTKSAQFPFHFWLPHAMAAPTPVSAYLHSATMVKAGIFLLILLWPVLSGTDEWLWLVGGAGVCTFLLGSFSAIFQKDMKGLLAYSTISHLGLIVFLIGLSTPLAMVAAIFHVINHATFKASLFMAVGIIDHECGTRDMGRLRGLFKVMPYTAVLAIVASAAMAGVPLLNGFISKEMFFAETLAAGVRAFDWMSGAALLMGMFSVVYALRFIQVFFGQLATDLPREPKEAPRWMRIPVEFLVLSCLVVGMVPAFSIGVLLDQAVQSVLHEQTPHYDLALWHGFNLPLLMSCLALSLGLLLFWVLWRYANLQQASRTPLLSRLDGKALFESFMLRLVESAGAVERFFGTRRLQPQLFSLLAVGALAMLLILNLRDKTTWPLYRTDIDFGLALLWLLGAACAIAAAWQAKYHRLVALMLVGGVGVVTCLTFLRFSAPDLALTQLVVETVTIVLLLLGLRWLPPRLAQINPPRSFTTKVRRVRDFILALSVGLIMAVVSYAVMMKPSTRTLSDYFLLNALPGGGGTNVVNVLLVDFRSFDTLGEITVLSLVALTVYALLRRFRPAPDSTQPPIQQNNALDPASHQDLKTQLQRGYLWIPSVYLQWLLPITMVVAIYLFMRGHNLPGGGFIAGLVFASSLIAQYMLGGTLWTELRFRLRLQYWIGSGLLLALFTGLGAWLFGFPLLTTHTAHVLLPGLGEVHVPTAFLFDLGVFVTVVGTTMLILVALAHQALRTQLPVLDGQPDENTLKNLRERGLY